MGAASKIRTLIFVPDPQQSRALLAQLADCSDFEVVAAANDPGHARDLSRTLVPDMLIVDDDGAQGELCWLHDLLLERALPTLLMTGEHSAVIPPWLKKAGVSPLSRELIRSDEETIRSHVRTRLQLLGARCSARRRTQTASTLAQAMARVRARSRIPGLSPRVESLTKRPLDLLVLIGGEGSASRFRQLLSTWTAPAVPVLAALDDPRVNLRATELADPKKIVTRLDESVPLREMHGLWLLGPQQDAELVKGIFQVATSPHTRLDLNRLARSTGSLGERCLAIMLEGSAEDGLSGLQEASRHGVQIATINPTDEDSAKTSAGRRASLQGARLLLESNLASVRLGTQELSCLMRHLVARCW